MRPFKYDTVKVIDVCFVSLPREVEEEISDEQANGSYSQVHLDPEQSCTPLTVAWLKENGIEFNPNNPFEYVLFYINW